MAGRSTFRRALGILAASAALGASALGCDLCGCYTPQLETLPELESARASWPEGLYLGIAEQFASFSTLQLEGNEVENSTGQYLDSSVTQLVAGYSLAPRFALQINLPFIHRTFRRPEGFAIDRGTEAGLGDISVLLKSVIFHYSSSGGRGVDFGHGDPVLVDHGPDFTASVVLLTGLELPTGDPSRLQEEFNEVEIEGAPESGIHGHDLTLGSGSVDGIFGGQISTRYRSFFFQTDVQFALRGDGAHQYHFANDLSWNGGPGYYFLRKKDALVGMQCACSGEHKDLDRFRGDKAEDTGLTSVFVGPRLIASWHHWSGEIAAELPVSIENTALQIVPDYRIRGGIVFDF